MENELSFGSRLKHAWNAFRNRDPTYGYYMNSGGFYTRRPDRPRLTRGNERSIVTSVINRIALDVVELNIQHCKLDENGRFASVIDSTLNNCLTVEANIDQTARAFKHDAAMSLLDEGCIAIVPVDTSFDPKLSSSYNILTLRVGKVTEWYPTNVKVRLYNDLTGYHEEIILPKKSVGIVENPLYAVMNESNSTMQRLIRKLNLLDSIDEQSGSGKLDLIIGLPYQIKTQARLDQAEKRRKDIEGQLANSKYGIAYTDSTEKITQLNRPVENNLMKQIEYLTDMLYSQLGITQGVLDGSADESTMLNYYTRTVDPIAAAIVDEMNRKFLTKTARSQGQSIMCFRDPFKLTSLTDFASAADTFTRNEILSKNEVRQKMGLKPSNDPKADQLINSNISQSADAAKPADAKEETDAEESTNADVSENADTENTTGIEFLEFD